MKLAGSDFRLSRIGEHPMKLLNLITACVAAAALAGCASNTNQLTPDAAPDVSKAEAKQQADSQAEASQGDASQPEANQPDADQGAGGD
jgi:outer membrane murein-binding lipoprotein Lpp